jgi:dephospho-CoA kinase
VAKILLVAGTPASGKTSFGDYLRDKKDFVHVDIEAFEGSYLHSVWVAALKLKDMSLFLNTLKERNPNTVLSWGFHLDDLQVAADLKRAGAKLWWFEADEGRARERFIARNGVSIDVFEAQMKRIRNNRAKIEELFQPNILNTLKPDNTCMTFGEIFDAVRGMPSAPEKRFSFHF